jgi:hypothetical protein
MVILLIITDGYSIGGYLWIFYWWILVIINVIILLFIGGCYTNGY